MRKTLIRTMIAAVACLAVSIGCIFRFARAELDIVYGFTAESGDPSVLNGLVIKDYTTRYGRLFISNLKFGRDGNTVTAEGKTLGDVVTSDVLPIRTKEYKPIVLNEMTPYILTDLFGTREFVEYLDVALRLDEYYRYYPELLTTRWYGCTSLLNEFLRIPVIPEEKLMVSLHEYGWSDTRSISFVGEDHYQPKFYQTINERSLFFTISTHTEQGNCVDTSLIPGGYGIYILPYTQDKKTDWVWRSYGYIYMLPEVNTSGIVIDFMGNPAKYIVRDTDQAKYVEYTYPVYTADTDNMRVFYPLDPQYEVLGLESTEDGKKICVLLTKDGRLSEVIFDSETAETIAQIDLGEYKDEEIPILEGYSDLFLVLTQDSMFVTAPDAQGVWDVRLAVSTMKKDEGPDFSWWYGPDEEEDIDSYLIVHYVGYNEDGRYWRDASFDGERLALVESLHTAENEPAFRLAVVTKDGCVYDGLVTNSLRKDGGDYQISGLYCSWE